MNILQDIGASNSSVTKLKDAHLKRNTCSESVDEDDIRTRKYVSQDEVFADT